MRRGEAGAGSSEQVEGRPAPIHEILDQVGQGDRPGQSESEENRVPRPAGDPEPRAAGQSERDQDDNGSEPGQCVGPEREL